MNFWRTQIVANPIQTYLANETQFGEFCSNLRELNFNLLDLNQNCLNNYMQPPCSGAKSPSNRPFTDKQLLRNEERTRLSVWLMPHLKPLLP